MRVDLADPRAKRAHDRMVRLNKFFAAVKVGPVQFRGLRRIYNNGNLAGFAWDKGGRLYAVGGSYQTMPKALRPTLTIDGEATVEIDIRASHLTILAQRMGMALSANLDPYDVEDIPRAVVKAFVTMTLGHDRFHRRWPQGVRDRLEPLFGNPLRKAYPLSKVKAAVLHAIPALRDWGDNPTSCFDLVYEESEALLSAVERLAFIHKVPVLPLHDSIIVPASHAELAAKVLGDCFYKIVGVGPQLK
jgi:hypothetical protein